MLAEAKVVVKKRSDVGAGHVRKLTGTRRIKETVPSHTCHHLGDKSSLSLPACLPCK